MLIQLYPAGFYVLGVEIREDSIVAPWSLQGLRMVAPGEQHEFITQVERPSKASTVHSWGLCRLLRVQAGNVHFEPVDGALFITLSRTIQPATVLIIVVEALDFEPFTTIEG